MKSALEIMSKKAITALFFSFAIWLVPAAGESPMRSSGKLAVVLGLVIASTMLQPSCSPFRRASSVQDQGTMLQILWSVVIAQIATMIEASYFSVPESTAWHLWSFFPLAMMILGIAMRTMAVRTLGQSFTMEIRVVPKQTIICSGPYRFMRHPSYLGAFLAFTAVPIFLSTWFSLLLTVVVLGAAFIRRISWEEKSLRETLGYGYVAYANRVKRAIPGIW